MTNRTKISPVWGWQSRGGIFLLPACIPGGWKWEWVEGRSCELRERSEDIWGASGAAPYRGLEMPITDNKLPFFLLWAAPGVTGMSPVPLPVPGEPPGAAQSPRSGGPRNSRQARCESGAELIPSHAPRRHQGGSGSRAGKAEGCWAPRQLRDCSAGFGNGFPITEPRSACPGLGLPRSSLLITGPIFC